MVWLHRNLLSPGLKLIVRIQTFAGPGNDDKRESRARLSDVPGRKRAQIEIAPKNSHQRMAQIKKDSGSAR
jgi:hypothetical protein